IDRKVFKLSLYKSGAGAPHSKELRVVERPRSAAPYEAMTLEIVQTGNPVLRRVARQMSVDEIRSDSTTRLIEQMRDTMRAAPGVGLAAPQIGESIQLAVIEDRQEYVEDASPDELKEGNR